LGKRHDANINLLTMHDKPNPAFGDGLEDDRLGPAAEEVAARCDRHRQAGRPAGVSTGDGSPTNSATSMTRSGPGWPGSLGVRTSPVHAQAASFSRR
jgi:hypothetical protein